MLKYSVVIPVYKVEAYLPACLESVLSQDGDAAYEIILVDDGSPDGSGRICDQYAALHSNIRVIHSDNHGVSHARNLGLEQAEGQYVFFLDADDLWEANMLSAVTELVSDEPDIAAFGHVRRFEDGSRIQFRLPLKPEGESGEAWLERLFGQRKTPHFFPWCYVYRRAFLQANDLRFREDMRVSEDFEFNMRALACAGRVTGCDLPLYGYRIHGGSVTATLTAQKLMDNLTSKARYFRKYPVAAMANLYADNALLVCRLPAGEDRQALQFLQENRDIWDHVSQPPLKLGRMLVALLGHRKGAEAYRVIREISRKLRGKS